MAKADLDLPDGTKVTIDGSTEEITKILSAIGRASTGGRLKQPRQVGAHGRVKQGRSAHEGPTAYILELRDEGFFKAKRALNEIQKKLEEHGHIYARTTLSPILVKLVRRKELRRIKEGKRWAYVS